MARSCGPCQARTRLLAVITGRPRSSAAAMRARAGSSPPSSSMTRSTSSARTMAHGFHTASVSAHTLGRHAACDLPRISLKPWTDGGDRAQPEARDQGGPPSPPPRSSQRLRPPPRSAAARRRGNHQARQRGRRDHHLLLLASHPRRALPQGQAGAGAARLALDRLAAQELRILHRPGRGSRPCRGARRRADRQQGHLRRRDLVGAALRAQGERPAPAAPSVGSFHAGSLSPLPFALEENALARALRARREPYIDLTLSNPTAAGLPYEEEKIL